MSGSSPPVGPSINATKLLNIYNDYNDSITCVAHAPSQGRRCRNRINIHKRGIAQHILNGLSDPTRNQDTLYDRLLDLADQTTCWIGTHQGQAESVASRWYSTLMREADRLRSASATRRRSSGHGMETRRVSSRESLRNGPAQVQSITQTRGTVQITAVEESVTVSFTEPQHQQPSPPATVRLSALLAIIRTHDASNLGSDNNAHPPARVVQTAPIVSAAPSTPPTSPQPSATSPSIVSGSASRPTRATTEDHQRTHNHERAEETEDKNCSICLEEFSEPYKTPCGHTFCRDCISAWFAGEPQKTCPMDRRPLAWSELVEVKDRTCSICLEDAVEPCETPCGHRFCRGCMEGWFGGSPSKTCPMDRRLLHWSQLRFEDNTQPPRVSRNSAV